MELSKTKMEHGPKEETRQEKKSGFFGKGLLAGMLISAAVGFGACTEVTPENQIPIPNAQKDAGPDQDGGKDGGTITEVDGGQGGSDGGAGGTDGGTLDGGQGGQDAGQDLDAGQGGSDGGQGGQDAGQDLDAGQGGQDAGQDLDSGTGGSDGGVVPDGGQAGQDGGVIDQDSGVDLDAGQGGSDGGVVPDGGQAGQDGGIIDLDGGAADGGQVQLQCLSAHIGSYAGYIHINVPIDVGGYNFYFEGEGAIPDGGVENAAKMSIKCGSTVLVPSAEYAVGVEKSFDMVPDNKRITIFPTQSGMLMGVVIITVEDITSPNDGGVDAGTDAGVDADAGYNPPACVEATTGTYGGYVGKINPVNVGGYVFLFSGQTNPDGGPKTAKYNIACGGSPVATDIDCPLNVQTVLDVPADYRRITIEPTQIGLLQTVVNIKVEYN